MGRALKEILLHFNWKRIAVIYTDDMMTRKCYSVAEGLRKVIAATNVVNVYNMGVDRQKISDEEIKIFLDSLPSFARSNNVFVFVFVFRFRFRFSFSFSFSFFV